MKKKKTERDKQLEALELENEEAVREMIRRLLEKPMNKRTNFLRKRIPGGSCL